MKWPGGKMQRDRCLLTTDIRGPRPPRRLAIPSLWLSPTDFRRRSRPGIERVLPISRIFSDQSLRVGEGTSDNAFRISSITVPNAGVCGGGLWFCLRLSETKPSQERAT